MTVPGQHRFKDYEAWIEKNRATVASEADLFWDNAQGLGYHSKPQETVPTLACNSLIATSRLRRTALPEEQLLMQGVNSLQIPGAHHPC
eukprot:15437245-Alexandrium_andersonii.AAC.1